MFNETTIFILLFKWHEHRSYRRIAEISYLELMQHILMKNLFRKVSRKIPICSPMALVCVCTFNRLALTRNFPRGVHVLPFIYPILKDVIERFTEFQHFVSLPVLKMVPSSISILPRMKIIALVEIVKKSNPSWIYLLALLLTKCRRFFNQLRELWAYSWVITNFTNPALNIQHSSPVISTRVPCCLSKKSQSAALWAFVWWPTPRRGTAIIFNFFCS